MNTPIKIMGSNLCFFNGNLRLLSLDLFNNIDKFKVLMKKDRIMTKEDRLEVIEIVNESAKIIARELNSNLINIIEKQNKETRHTLKEVMNEQTDRFIAALKPYEQKTEEHERKLKKIRDILDE